MKKTNQTIGDILFREFHLEDYDEVISLWKKAGLTFKPRGRDLRRKIAREITEPTALFRVAVKDGCIIGTVLGTHDGRRGWINRLAVHPDYRRMGLAARLVRLVEQELYDLGIEIVASLVEADNPASMTLFEQLGFVKHEDIIYFSTRLHPDV